MANIKNGSLREIVIDRCLRSRDGHSTQDILEMCNAMLERRGELPVSSANTIRADIHSIENRYGIIVEEVRVGRNIRYRYEDPDFSIFKTPLTQDEITQLTQSVSLLRRFEGMPGFEWIDELNVHLQTTVNGGMKPVVGFDENAKLKGMTFFTPLFNFINNRQVVKITYHSYKINRSFEATVHPYYLKEYNQRWFLFGLNEKYGKITPFALDRIERLDLLQTKYIMNESVDFETYFDEMVGVTIPSNKEVEEVLLLIDVEQLPYVLSKPIHKSQRLVKTNEDGSAIIVIHVIPNFELIQLLLSFGERVTILSPASLRQEIIGRIEKNMKNYQ